MRRRITFAIVGSVVATAVLVGLGTLLLVRFGARERTRTQLATQAEDIAASIQEADDQRNIRLLANLRTALRLEGIDIITIGPGGRVVGSLPDGVSVADLDVAALRAGDTVSGNHGSLVWAAAPTPVPNDAAAARGAIAVVVVTRKADVLLRPAYGWFLLASLITITVGVLVAMRLSRRLTNRLRQADDATRRLAGGDLSVRVPEPPGGTDDELADLARSINSMAAALERSQGLERQFLLSVSHDLRTPLTSIRGYAEAIADGAAPDDGAAAKVILAEARRLERLVRDLLDLAKLDAREFSLHPEPVDLADVAAGTAEGFAPEADEAGVRLSVEAGPIVPVHADPDRLAQVAANLVENALKYATTTVRLQVTSANGWGALAVVDDGPGIAADDLPHVFERLYVTKREPRRKEAGSGLGLAIVRELVSAMDGTVAAHAAPTGGAALVVYLPLERVENGAAPPTSAPGAIS